jgi:glucokinase
MLILAGDIGGTSARIAYFRSQDERLELVCQQVFPSGQFSGIADLVAEFVASRGEQADVACFSIAGAVRGDKVITPNLGWRVDAAEVSRRLAIGTVHLMNDLEANACGIATLDQEDFALLNAGAPEASGNEALISAGTGLGEAGLYWNGKQHHPFATEGGHADFAPRNKLEVELFLYLLDRFGRVSWERVVSGPGLYNIYQFLRDTGPVTELRDAVEAMRQEGAPAAISRFALAGACPLCVRALDMFVSLYGAEAGNLALKVMATGGMFIGGGIAPKIIEKLQGPLFMETFAAKGRLKSLMEAMPVRVIMNDLTALRGAARYAALRFT